MRAMSPQSLRCASVIEADASHYDVVNGSEPIVWSSLQTQAVRESVYHQSLAFRGTAASESQPKGNERVMLKDASSREGYEPTRKKTERRETR